MYVQEEQYLHYFMLTKHQSNDKYCVIRNVSVLIALTQASSWSLGAEVMRTGAWW